MKNKKKIGLLVLIIFIILVVIISVIIINKDSKNNISNHENENSEMENLEDTIKVTNIESTSDNPIKKDGIEATKLIVTANSNEVQVETTLKNNTNELLEGFFIKIALLDKDGNIITTIAKNSTDNIEANDEITIMNNVTECDDAQKIVRAEIKTLEKKAPTKAIESTFNEVEEMLD